MNSLDALCTPNIVDGRITCGVRAPLGTAPHRAVRFSNEERGSVLLDIGASR